MKILNGSNKIFKKINNCRVCQSNKLKKILDLGNHPLANSLRENDSDREVKIPLILMLCKNCNVAQLEHTVNPKVMFSNYLWVTGTSNTTIEYAKKFYKYSRNLFENNPNKILELASNDGTFKNFKDNGSKVFGIDPAENIAKLQ